MHGPKMSETVISIVVIVVLLPVVVLAVVWRWPRRSGHASSVDGDVSQRPDEEPDPFGDAR